MSLEKPGGAGYIKLSKLASIIHPSSTEIHKRKNNNENNYNNEGQKLI